MRQISRKFLNLAAKILVFATVITTSQLAHATVIKNCVVNDPCGNGKINIYAGDQKLTSCGKLVKARLIDCGVVVISDVGSGPTIDYSCQQISNKYGASHRNTWGSTPEPLRDLWMSKGCNTCKPGDKKKADGSCFTPVVCSGTGNLKANEEIWRRASNMWKTKDGSKTYCAVKCPTGTKLTHKGGDTHFCKPELTCQQISNKYGASHRNTWGSTPEPHRELWMSMGCTTCKPGDKKNANGHCFTPVVCSGTGDLKVNEEIWRRASNMWKTKDGSKTYCAVKCPTGTTLTHKGGDTHFCKPALSCQQISDKYGLSYYNGWGTSPGFIRDIAIAESCDTCKPGDKKKANGHCYTPVVCSGTGNLKVNEEIWRRASNMWKTKDGSKTYCAVKCPTGTKLTHKGGDTHFCKPELTCQQLSNKYGVSHHNGWGSTPGPLRSVWMSSGCNTCKPGDKKKANGHCFTPSACSGTGNLKVNEEIWRRASNMWKTKDGSKTYCAVKCPASTTLTHKGGDTHFCKPALSCQQISDKYSKSHYNGWGSTTQPIRTLWLSMGCNTCRPGDKKKANGHCYTPVVCSGTGNLKVNEEIWRRASNMWKTKDGSKTYCAVKCPTGTKLTHKGGDTHFCKPELTCQQLSNKYGVSHHNGWGSTPGPLRSVWMSSGCNTCKPGDKKKANGHCFTPSACSGTGNLKVNEEIWRRASNMWKTKDGSKTYCAVKCPTGTKLTHKGGDTNFCKPELTCQQISNKYGFSYYNGWGASPGFIRKIIIAERCDTCKPGDTKKANGHCFTQSVCSGTGNLKVNEEIWRRASNMWKTKDGSKTYCAVKCPTGTKLTHKGGDTHFCKP